MTFLDKNNKFSTYLIILLALFIVVLITRNQIITLQENIDEKESKEIILVEKRLENDKLDNIKKKLKVDDSEINKYLIDFNEDEIIDYIYSHVDNSNSTIGGISFIKNITFTKGEKNEMGFTESLITLKMMVENEAKMRNILSFLTSKESKYNFFIESFTFPNVVADSSFNISIPLKILYK